MPNKYDYRRQNAKRVCAKITEHLDAGKLVFDDEGTLILQGQPTWDEDGFSIKCGNSRMCYFVDDIDLDNGMHTSIKEFNEQFRSWKIINPKHIERLSI